MLSYGLIGSEETSLCHARSPSTCRPKPRYREKEMEKQLRSTPTLVEGANEHRDSQSLGRRERGNHHRFSGTLVRGRTGDFLYRRPLWGADCDLANRAGTGPQGYRRRSGVRIKPNRLGDGPSWRESIFDVRMGFCALIFGIALAVPSFRVRKRPRASGTRTSQG
jgi:hypothetical protein